MSAWPPGTLRNENAKVSAPAPLTAKRTGARQLARNILTACIPISVAGKLASPEAPRDSEVATVRAPPLETMPMHTYALILRRLVKSGRLSPAGKHLFHLHGGSGRR